MNWLQTLRLAFKALMRNLFRSFLTALGIIIGVGAVITMVSIGEGARSRVEQATASMGANILIVMSGSSSAGGVRGGFGTQPTLTRDDLRAMQTELSQVDSAAADLRTNAQLQSEEQNWATSVHGTSAAFHRIREWPVEYGAALTDSDVESATKVVVLGATVAEKLFGSPQDSLGQLVRIKGVPFQVIGVLSKKGQSGNGQDNDDTALVPLSTYLQRLAPALGRTLPGTILIKAVNVPAAISQVTTLLRDRHRIRDGADDDFSVRNLADVANAQQANADTFALLLAAVAAVSLLVGGIGIMNIMLVSVTERTREIGIRMAIGATPGQVLSQFLVEALTLSLLGGLIGMAAGVGTAMGLSAYMQWPSLIRVDVLIIAPVFSALVGVGFGMYPALKASRLDPIVALRFE